MSFLTLQAVSAVAPDGHHLFSDLSFSLGSERIGLVGRNGSGKSTLFRMVSGEVVPSQGHIAVSGRVGILHQTPKGRANSLAELLGVADALACLTRIESGQGTEDDFANADWTLPARLELALEQVGLSGQPLTRSTGTLSGGEATRVNLARLILDEPDILLLDEPTNNLDAAGRQLVADFLSGWKSGVIIASHDRQLLEGMDRIIHLSPVGVSIHAGGWSAFEAARAAELERAQNDVERAGKKLAQTNRGIQQQAERKARREAVGKAARRSRSQSKLFLDAQKERAEGTAARDAGLAARQRDEAEADLETARKQIEVLTPLTIDLPDPKGGADKRLLSVVALQACVNGQPISEPVSFEMRGPGRLAVRGENGAGKSTLLRTILKAGGAEILPQIELGDIRIAMLDQHVSILKPDVPLIDQLLEVHSTMTVNDTYALLARYAFRNSDAHRLPGSLSGGECMRAGLAMMTGGNEVPHLLILDEPTNHLDIDSIEILEHALEGFKGGILAVSHDDRFLKAIGCEQGINLKKLSIDDNIEKR